MGSCSNHVSIICEGTETEAAYYNGSEGASISKYEQEMRLELKSIGYNTDS